MTRKVLDKTKRKEIIKMLTPTASDVAAAVLAAPDDSEIFLTITALELVMDSLLMTELYGFNYYSGRAGRSINILNTPGAPAVLVLADGSFNWGCTDVDTGRRFLVGKFGLYFDTNEDGVDLDLLGGESFISF